MTDNILIDLSMNFAVEIVNLCESLKGKSSLTNQLLRSGTSIGANIHEANYASSKADFISKMQIALKECHETEYWLKLFVKTNTINGSIYNKLSNDSGKIRRILIASINTAKGNIDK
ncbi:MAG: four helix bundle protein [Clostridia bacterium]|nr:four helix bundle protein [Clostridia bacterium]